MCFTVNVNIVKEELEERYHARLIDTENYRPSYYYHAFSIPKLPVVHTGNRKFIELMNWGLIPSWVRDSEKAEEIRYKTFNARADSIDTKPSFANSFISKRCIIPVNGFFEWQHVGEKKIPWYVFRADEDIISLAGLWSEWMDNTNGKVVKTFTVITTEANEMMARIHNSKKRMPVILERSAEEKWLDLKVSRDKLMKLLEPYPGNVLRAYTIGTLINKKDADKNRADLIKPVDYNISGKLL